MKGSQLHSYGFDRRVEAASRKSCLFQGELAGSTLVVVLYDKAIAITFMKGGNGVGCCLYILLLDHISYLFCAHLSLPHLVPCSFDTKTWILLILWAGKMELWEPQPLKDLSTDLEAG